MSVSVERAADHSVASGPHPSLAPDVELLGELQGSGFQHRQWLVRRGDRFVQLTDLLYRLAEQANGEQTYDEIAARLTESTDWSVEPEQVRQLIAAKLEPLGLVVSSEREHVHERDSRLPSPLAVNMRVKVIGPGIVNPVADALKVLYAPRVMASVLVAAAVAHAWLYFVHGVTQSLDDIIYVPWQLAVVLVLLVLGGAFHEFGHAAALRYARGQVRGMGVGFYLIYPAFYTDVTDGYRLGRWARVRTDLGGIYFNLLFALGLIAAHAATGQPLLLAAALLVDLDAIRQLLPVGRLDGYWTLADLTGVPDPFSQLGPVLKNGVALGRSAVRNPTQLKRWVAGVLMMYMLLLLPLLAALLWLTLVGLPTFAVMLWQAVQMQAATLEGALSQRDPTSLTAALLQLAMLAVPVLATGVLLYALGVPAVLGLWKWSKPSLPRRFAGGIAAVGAAALLGTTWSPQIVPLFAASSVPDNAPEGVETFRVTSRLHVQGTVEYPQTPPVGGNHAPIWQNCGFYTTPVQNENAVHSLEHGAVWITYQPDLPASEVELLRAYADAPRAYVIVSPYDGLPAPVVASAWGYQLKLTSATDPRLNEFVRAFRLGPQAPERDGPCTGGVGNPG